MDETEVMQQKIQELEAEVKRLKAMLPEEKQLQRLNLNLLLFNDLPQFSSSGKD